MKVPAIITTIVWDLDGTLLDSFGIHEDIVSQVLPKHGHPVPPRQQMLDNYHGPLEDSLGALLQNATDAEKLAVIRDFLEIDNQYIKDVNKILFPDAVSFARRAHQHGLRQVLLTNRAHGTDRGLASPRGMVEHSVLRELIDDIICGDEATYRKPDARALEPFFTRHHFKPEEVLVVGDQFVDAQFAHNLRAHGILVQRHDKIANLDRLADGWDAHVQLVRSLDEVTI